MLALDCRLPWEMLPYQIKLVGSGTNHNEPIEGRENRYLPKQKGRNAPLSPAGFDGGSMVRGNERSVIASVLLVALGRPLFLGRGRRFFLRFLVAVLAFAHDRAPKGTPSNEAV